MAALSPEDRFTREFLAMGAEPFAHAVKEVKDFEPEKQKGLLRAIADPATRDWWKRKKKKAKKFPKDREEIETLRALASSHGVDLT